MTSTVTQPYDLYAFRTKVQKALRDIATVLETNKRPQFPRDVPHTYDDKYLLAQLLTNSAVAAQLNSLEALGLDKEKLKTLVEFATDRAVTLRIKSVETCTFDREEEREVESASYVTERTGVFGSSTTTEKVVSKVTDYFWNFSVTYEIFAFRGNDPEDKVTLQERRGSCVLKKLNDKTSPQPSQSVQPSIDLNITWLLQTLNKNLLVDFTIDRNSKDTHTPRRNPQVEAAINFMNNFYIWANTVSVYFQNHLFPIDPISKTVASPSLYVTSVFVPVLPLCYQSPNQSLLEDGKEEYDSILILFSLFLYSFSFFSSLLFSLLYYNTNIQTNYYKTN
eukprot:TRINITY_DN3339_c0_g1_i2.p1 TRINITY_DN3339_c0_g1~~TRINITY_DN3339_c0_g1_i2.p1  ORF type:complete len:347 (+),score=85.66 TRINITY_DN3339_c0_g1_i2:34-1041(+)